VSLQRPKTPIKKMKAPDRGKSEAFKAADGGREGVGRQAE